MSKRAIIQKVEPSGEIKPPRFVVKTAWDEWAEWTRHAVIGFVFGVVTVGMWLVCGGM